MVNRKTILAGAFAGLALIGSAVAFAQTPPVGPTPPDRDAMRRQMHARVCAEAPARFAARIAYAEVKLGITDAQKGAWQAFVTDAKAAAQPMMKLCDTPPANVRGDAVAELSQRERFLGATLETTKGMRMAVEKLTPTLTADQKTKLADLIRMEGRRGMQRGGHHGGPQGGPGPQRGPQPPMNAPAAPPAPAPTK